LYIGSEPIKADPFADARLVEELRLYYSYIIEGRYSEQFYICLFKIIKKEIYKGYFTFSGKQVKLKGIIDFLHSKHYGLGIKDISEFMIAYVDQMIYDETESQYARQIVKWLRKQHYTFKFPRKAYELERLLSWIRFKKSKNKIKPRDILFFIEIYNKFPDILPDIGEGRRYKDFEQAAIACDITKAIRKRNIALNEDMNEAELRSAARGIYSVLGEKVNHRLIELMIECQELHGFLPSEPRERPMVESNKAPDSCHENEFDI
jgi:hypothetical protein